MKVSDAACSDMYAAAITTYGFREIGHDDDGLVVVVDFDYGAVELLQRLVEAMHALGNPLQKQRLPLLLQCRNQISDLVSSASWCGPPSENVALTCGFSMARSDDDDGGDSGGWDHRICRDSNRVGWLCNFSRCGGVALGATTPVETRARLCPLAQSLLGRVEPLVRQST